MTQKIALMGGPDSGKSTQCAHFFAMLKSESISIEQVQEFARESLNKKQLPQGNPWAELLIYQEQKLKEDCIPQTIKYMVTDSPKLLSYVYVLQYAKRPYDNYLLIKMYENFVNDIGSYDFIFLCSREKAYSKDGTRFQNENEAKVLDSIIVNLLDMHTIPYTVLSGNVEERTKKMRDTIKI